MAKGWGNPRPYGSHTKFHYFGEDGRSLCGKWGNLGGISLEDGKDEHPSNCCKECLRRKSASEYPK